MKTYRRIHWFVIGLLFVSLLLPAVSNAQQQAINGMVMLVDGDLWSFDPQTGSTQQLTSWGYNGIPVVSPDIAATYIAYRSVSERHVNSGDIYAGDRPSNIWLLNKQDGSFRRIADHPAYLDTIRSTPDWSPDGTRLTWTELDITPGEFSLSNARLVTYNINTNQKDIITTDFNIGHQDGGLHMPRVDWGEGGIIRTLFQYLDGGSGFVQTLELWNPDTHQVQFFEIASGTLQNNNGDFAWEVMWAMENNKPYIVLYMRNSGWQRLDPTTGTRTGLATPPSLGVRWGIPIATMLTPQFQQVGDSHHWRWQARLEYDGGAAGKTVDLGGEALTLARWSLPALSGSYQIAWATAYQQGINRSINVWEDSNTQQVRRIITSESEYGEMAVAWLPLQWYITDSTPPPPIPTPTPYPPGQCPPTHPTVFEPGELVQVSPGPPNNLRATPSVNGRVLGVLPAGTMVTVLSTPVCVDGFNWYNVQYTHGSGWTAEGDGTEYWLQPAG